MTRAEIATMVESIGLPFAYYEFPDSKISSPPFICYYYGESNNVSADNKNYAKVEELYIEFYSDDKDFDTETTIEAVLDEHDLFYSKESTYIGDQQMYETIYLMEVLING